MKKSLSQPDTSAYEADLERTLQQIGLARFVARINSGVIPRDKGYAAVERYVTTARQRPLLSKLTHFVLGRSDAYANR